jgi:gamma-glutamyltranspeptidase/glutathione hydrolase
VAEVLLQIVGRGKDLRQAVAAPRLHTEGALAVTFERAWPAGQAEALKERGYAVSTGTSATISAVSTADVGGKLVAAMR